MKTSITKTLTTAAALLLFTGNLSNAQNFVWAKKMGGTDLDRGHSIALDGSGNVYTTGYFNGTVDFDPGAGVFNLTSSGFADIFISKLDTSGNFVWAKKMGGTFEDYGYSIAIDDSGNIFTTGFFYGTADFDPGADTFNLTSIGGPDIFISKLDVFGNFVWAKKLGGIIEDWGFSIALDDSGNVYTTGYFEGTADFDPGADTFNLTSSGGEDIFISKLDVSGNFVWAKKMGGTFDERGFSIALDDSGNVYTTGGFYGTADFDPGAGTFNLTSNGVYDIFISKLDASGNFVWAKNMGGTSADYGNSITLDDSGNVYTTGYFQGTADFNPGADTFNLISNGFGDIFISKLDTSGNFVWAKKMGGTDNDYGFSIALDDSGNVYTTGYFADTVDFDPGADTFNLTSSGGEDIFISKLDASGNFVWAKKMGGVDYDRGLSIALDNSGNVYTTGSFYGTADFDPGAGTFNLTSGGSVDIFVHKMSQCVVDNNITKNVDTLTANQTAATYQWLYCDSNFAAISGANNQSYVVTASGNYAVKLTANGCTDTSSCINVLVSGINELGASDLSIYPNPVTNQFTIEVAHLSQNTAVTITSMEGKLVDANVTINANAVVIDADDWAKGVYLVTISDKEHNFVAKLIKQ